MEDLRSVPHLGVGHARAPGVWAHRWCRDHHRPTGARRGNSRGHGDGGRFERGLLDPDADRKTTHVARSTIGSGSSPPTATSKRGSPPRPPRSPAGNASSNLCVIWDDNRISIEGDTNVAIDEDVVARYRAYGWHVHEVEALASGDVDLEGLDTALRDCRRDRRPTHFHPAAHDYRLACPHRPRHGKVTRRRTRRRGSGGHQASNSASTRPSNSLSIPSCWQPSEVTRAERARTERSAWESLFESWRARTTRINRHFWIGCWPMRVPSDLPECASRLRSGSQRGDPQGFRRSDQCSRGGTYRNYGVGRRTLQSRTTRPSTDRRVSCRKKPRPLHPTAASSTSASASMPWERSSTASHWTVSPGRSAAPSWYSAITCAALFALQRLCRCPAPSCGLTIPSAWVRMAPLTSRSSTFGHCGRFPVSPSVDQPMHKRQPLHG